MRRRKYSGGNACIIDSDSLISCVLSLKHKAHIIGMSNCRCTGAHAAGNKLWHVYFHIWATHYTRRIFTLFQRLEPEEQEQEQEEEPISGSTCRRLFTKSRPADSPPGRMARLCNKAVWLVHLRHDCGTLLFKFAAILMEIRVEMSF